MKTTRTQGFTLIELLIVVAIIAILAAIAVPNFLEAQMRSKVSKAKSDLRVMATAMESYIVDYNRYMPATATPINGLIGTYQIVLLTTPVAYLTAIPADPFQDSKPAKYPRNTIEARKNYDPALWPMYAYCPYSPATGWNSYGWSIRSMGPDLEWDMCGVPSDGDGFNPFLGIYDPTNGTVSNGDIIRYGGESTVTRY